MKRILSLLLILMIVLSCSKDTVTPTPEPTPKFTVSISAGEGGSVSTEGGTYDRGTKVTITATPDGEFLFDKWSDGNTDNPREITVTSNLSISASFVKKKYALVLNIEGEGVVEEEIIVQGSTSTTEYNSGTTIRLTATPSDEWVFSGWSGAFESTNNPIEISVDEAKEITATFKLKQYELTINIEGEGTVTESIVTQPTLYDSGTVVKLEATPNEGWVFAGWSGDVESDALEIEVTIEKSTAVSALFVLSYFKEEDLSIYTTSFENHHFNNLIVSPYITDQLPGNPFVSVGFDYIHLDDDGYRDVVVKDEAENGKFRFYLSDASRNFTEQPSWSIDSSINTFGARKLISADFNNDGLIDLVYCSAPDDTVTEKGIFLLKNTGAGFERMMIYGGPDFIDGKPTGYWSHYVAAGDVNGDGNVDIIGGSMPNVYLGNGDFSFTPKELPEGIIRFDQFLQRMAMIEFQNMELFDIDGDGYLDVLGSLNRNTTDYSGDGLKNTFEIFYGNYSDQFFESEPYVLNSNYEGTNVTMGIAVDDVDGDGDYDLFVNSSFNYEGRFVIQYYRNEGNRTFVNRSSELFEDESNYMDIGSDPDWIKMVDVDHDGIKELIIEGGFGAGGGNCCYDFNGFKFNSSGKMERFLFSGW